MKSAAYLTIFFGFLFAFSNCEKESGPSERFKLLTTPTWASDSLLVDGVDASGPGELLENFKGDAKFNADGTGYFGIYEGTWRFAMNETELVIESQSLDFPLSTKITELSKTSLIITTSYPNITNPEEDIQIRMTFIAK
jgi:hypothetical protein